MEDRFIKSSTLEGIADAIRIKRGTTEKIPVSKFREQILSITVKEGGSAVNLQEKTITENGQYTPDTGYNGFSLVTVDVQKVIPIYKGEYLHL